MVEGWTPALRWEPMRPPTRATPRFRDTWSLHVVRYAAVAFVVFAWS